MNFNKKQLQIISYCLALLESDCENADTKQEIHNMLGNMQSKNIWGRCEFYNECEMCEGSMTLEEFKSSKICFDCLENPIKCEMCKTSMNHGDYRNSDICSDCLEDQ